MNLPTRCRRRLCGSSIPRNPCACLLVVRMHVEWTGSAALPGIVFLQRPLQRPSPARRFSLFFHPTELVVPETLKVLFVVSRRLIARHSHGCTPCSYSSSRRALVP